MAVKIILGVIAGVLIFFFVSALVIAVSSIFVNGSREYSHDSSYFRFLLYFATFFAVIFVRIRVKSSGLEKLPSGRFLLVSNHRSKFDPILTWHVMRKQNLAYISKPSNFKVPVFGRIVRRCCFMSIDRDDPIKAARTVNHAAKLITDDEASVAVYPEGTRNYGDGLLPFHNGLFRIAQKAGVPIVVMSVRGTDAIHKNYPLRRSRVEINVLDVIPAETVGSTRTNDLGDTVRAILLEDLEGHGCERYKDNKIKGAI